MENTPLHVEEEELYVFLLNSKLIERKRQDTLEICRLFNEENNRHLIINDTQYNGGDNNGHLKKHRMKRDIVSNIHDNPTLKQEDILRVEKIVDKLYDDLDQDGNKITYRQRNVKKLTKGKKKEIDKINRRFNFAPAQLLVLEEEKEGQENSSTGLAARIPWIKKWKHGIIPFFIDPNTYDSLLSDNILKAFDYIEKVTCIRLQRLREKPTDKRSMQSVEWLYITNPSGLRQCVHSNERKPNTGVQMVVLGYDCLSQGEIAHEVMHILGFSHEHTRADRDRFITVFWDNIKPGYKKYFETKHESRLLNLPYDYASVLHYPPRAFSKNGQITIMAESGIKVGQREALSELDVEKIGAIYGLECVERNKDYLLKTCPSVVKMNPQTISVTPNDIQNYFKDRVWPYGIINYQIKDKVEFTVEERENMRAVFDHIEKETCLEFRDITEEDEVDNKDDTVIPASIELDNDENKLKEKNSTDTKIKSTTSVTTKSTKKKKIIKLTYKRHLTSPSKLKIMTEHDTSNEDLLRSGNNKAKYKHRISKSQKAKKIIKKTGPVLPKSPARRHATDVIMLMRSSKPGCHCPPAGRPNGNKEFIINADCFNSVNDLLHLIVHMIGLDHQHNMYDRDSFLQIIWDNLTPDIAEEMKVKLPPAASAGFAYDYQSVMHYPWLQIKDGVTNIMYPIWNDGWAMGHWQGLSTTDVQKINLIYMHECKKRKRHTANTSSQI